MEPSPTTLQVATVILVLNVFCPELILAHNDCNVATQYTIVENGTQLGCIDCPDCSFGKEPPKVCGSNISNSFSTKCADCIEGETFSDERGFKACKTCTLCLLNEIITTNCSRHEDTVCSGICMEDYTMNEGKTMCEPNQPTTLIVPKSTRKSTTLLTDKSYSKISTKSETNLNKDFTTSASLGVSLKRLTIGETVGIVVGVLLLVFFIILLVMKCRTPESPLRKIFSKVSCSLNCYTSSAPSIPTVRESSGLGNNVTFAPYSETENDTILQDGRTTCRETDAIQVLMDNLHCQEQGKNRLGSLSMVEKRSFKDVTTSSGSDANPCCAPRMETQPRDQLMYRLHSEEQGFLAEGKQSCYSDNTKENNNGPPIINLRDLDEEIYRKIIKAFCRDEIRRGTLAEKMNCSHDVVADLQRDVNTETYVSLLIAHWSEESSTHDLPKFIEILGELNMGELKDIVNFAYERIRK